MAAGSAFVADPARTDCGGVAGGRGAGSGLVAAAADAADAGDKRPVVPVTVRCSKNRVSSAIITMREGDRTDGRKHVRTGRRRLTSFITTSTHLHDTDR